MEKQKPVGIVYACVRLEPRTTIEHSAKGGRHATQAHHVLKKVDSAVDRRASYSSDAVTFHTVVATNIIFLCITEADYRQGLAYQFLDKVREAYISNRGPNANDSMQAHLRREMDFFNSPKADKLKNLQTEIAGVKDIMIDNIEHLMERGERIDSLCSRTSELADESHEFFDNSRTLRRKMWWKNLKLMLLIGFIVTLAIFILVLFLCGGFSFPKCKSDAPPPATAPPVTPAPTVTPAPSA
jgi:vesicle-associated membrane protein 7